jgi:hypothetical protein
LVRQASATAAAVPAQWLSKTFKFSPKIKKLHRQVQLFL